MTDEKIIDLYFSRNEAAIEETSTKYGRMLISLSYGILSSVPDAEECVNDTYLRTWKAIPPTKPHSLSSFLSKITRNLSLDRYRKNKGIAEMKASVVIEELYECIPDADGDPADDLALREAISDFLAALGKRERRIFVKRYFFAKEVESIAITEGVSISNVKVILHRTRLALKEKLEKEGITL